MKLSELIDKIKLSSVELVKLKEKIKNLEKTKANSEDVYNKEESESLINVKEYIQLETREKTLINAINEVNSVINGGNDINIARIEGNIITSSSDYSGSYAKENAFDGNLSSNWLSLGEVVPENTWIGFELKEPTSAYKIGIAGSSESSGVGCRDFKIKVSNNGTEWSELISGILPQGFGEIHYFRTNNITPYKYWRLYVNSVHLTGTSPGISEFEVIQLDRELTPSADITYDNTNSGLNSNTVQGALDEINNKVNSINNYMSQELFSYPKLQQLYNESVHQDYSESLRIMIDIFKEQKVILKDILISKGVEVDEDVHLSTLIELVRSLPNKIQ